MAIQSNSDFRSALDSLASAGHFVYECIAKGQRTQNREVELQCRMVE